MDRSRQGCARGDFTRLSKARERTANCERGVRCDRESRFYRGARVSRGNKFRQIVLPALYTVAHEVERSVPSVPVGRPSANGGCPPSVPSLAAASTSHCGCTPVIAGEGDMRLVPLERKRCHFLHAIFLAPTIVRSFPILPSPTLLDLSVPPSRPRSLDTTRYQPPLSIFCKRIPDFLIAINVRPIAAPFAALACSNVSAPRFSCLKFRSYPHALIPAYVFLDFSPLKSMPVCSRPFHHACSLPSFFPALQAILSIFLFGAPLPGNVPDFRCHCRFPSACASMRRTCVHLRINPSSLFSPITLPRLSSLPLVPATLSSQSVSACRRRVLRHISLSLCINFSSLLLSFPANDQYFVTFRLHTLSRSRGIKFG